MATHHNHHVIPKYAGGTDIPENIEHLTVAAHAEAHRLLYEEHGRWQDYLAWQGISGKIGKDEILHTVAVQAGKMSKGRKYKNRKSRLPETEETRKKKSEGMMGNTNSLGFKHTEKMKQKCSEVHLGKKKGPQTEEHKRNISEAKRGQVPWNRGKKKVNGRYI